MKLRHYFIVATIIFSAPYFSNASHTGYDKFYGQDDVGPTYVGDVRCNADGKVSDCDGFFLGPDTSNNQIYHFKIFGNLTLTSKGSDAELTIDFCLRSSQTTGNVFCYTPFSIPAFSGKKGDSVQLSNEQWPLPLNNTSLSNWAWIHVRANNITSNFSIDLAGRHIHLDNFSANPGTITSGQQSTLSWFIPNAIDGQVSIDGVVSNLPAEGTYIVNPTTTTTYTIRGSGPTGGQSNPVQVTAQTTVFVKNPVLMSGTLRADSCTSAPCDIVLNHTTSGATSFKILKDGTLMYGPSSINVPAGTVVDSGATVGTYIYSLYGSNDGTNYSFLATAQATASSGGAQPPGPTKKTLSVTVNGSGSVSDNTGSICSSGTCSKDYPTGTTVSLTANPASGWTLSSWGGDCAGQPNPCSGMMDVDRNVTANFAVIPGTGITGSITCNGQSGSCNISVGGSATYDWDSKKATNCNVLPYDPAQGWTGKKGTKTDSAPATRRVDLDCWNATSSGVVASVQVNVGISPPPLGGSSATASCTVIVNPPIPNEPSNVTVTQPNYCISGPAATINWTYSDPSGSPQSAYQVQIDDQGSFNSPEVDSGKINSGSGSYFTGQGILQFNTTYRARVRTWNGYDSVSNWSNSSSTWETPLYAYPQVDFSWTANGVQNNPSPPLNKPVDFTDQTVFNGNPNGRQWSWLFGDGSSSTQQNPSRTYTTEGTYYVTLTATDNANQSCIRTNGPLIIQKPIPKWREIAPK